jgi:hypothetical protein
MTIRGAVRNIECARQAQSGNSLVQQSGRILVSGLAEAINDENQSDNAHPQIATGVSHA